MPSLTAMSKQQLLGLHPNIVIWRFTTSEFIHMARELGALWEYDFAAAKAGRVGKHAVLKFGVHTAGFLNANILLRWQNIKTIIARQMALRYDLSGLLPPNFVDGIPNGATDLGKEIARILKTRSTGRLKKIDGQIVLGGSIPKGSLLLVEDVSTFGTAFKEAVASIRYAVPTTRIIPCLLAILNRGGLKEISIEGVGEFKVIAVAEYPMNECDWPDDECPLCKMGSVAIKPKESEESWQQLITSQLP